MRRRGQGVRLPRVLRARPPAARAAARGRADRAAGVPGAAGGAAPGSPRRVVRALPGRGRDRRLAGRARGGRSARDGALLAAGGRVRPGRGRGGPGRRPGPAGADERVPADVHAGAGCSSGGGPGTRATRWPWRGGSPTSSASTSTPGTRWSRRRGADRVPGRQQQPVAAAPAARLLRRAAGRRPAHDRRGPGRTLGGGHHPAEPAAAWACTAACPSTSSATTARRCGSAALATGGLWAYLFWGAEYWLLRDAAGRPRYLRAFAPGAAAGPGRSPDPLPVARTAAAPAAVEQRGRQRGDDDRRPAPAPPVTTRAVAGRPGVERGAHQLDAVAHAASARQHVR